MAPKTQEDNDGDPDMNMTIQSSGLIFIGLNIFHISDLIIARQHGWHGIRQLLQCFAEVANGKVHLAVVANCKDTFAAVANLKKNAAVANGKIIFAPVANGILSGEDDDSAGPSQARIL